MASIYLTTAERMQLVDDFADLGSDGIWGEFLARKAAEHAARVCAEACRKMDGEHDHLYAEAIEAFIEQGKEGGV